MFTFKDRPFVEARRVYRALLQKHRDAIEDELDCLATDERLAMYGDCALPALHEGCTYHNAYGSVQERLFVAVADAFGIPPMRLDDCLFWLDEREAQIVAPACPYLERGVECHNAPMDGSRQCGCDDENLRAQALRRFRLASYSHADRHHIINR